MLQDPQSKISQLVNQPPPLTQGEVDAKSQPKDLGTPKPSIEGAPEAGISQPPAEVQGPNRMGFIEAQKQALQNGAKEKMQAKLNEYMAPKDDGPDRKGPSTPSSKPNLGGSAPEARRPEARPPTPKMPSLRMPQIGKPRF